MGVRGNPREGLPRFGAGFPQQVLGVGLGATRQKEIAEFARVAVQMAANPENVVPKIGIGEFQESPEIKRATVRMGRA